MPDKCFSVTTDKGNMGIVHGNPEMSDKSRAAIKAIVDAAVERFTPKDVSYVYCKSHVGPHQTGWCTVPEENQIPLAATSAGGAFEEVKAQGLPIFGYCPICYKFVANEDWYRSYKSKQCPEHTND